jgi:hypothetical protein
MREGSDPIFVDAVTKMSFADARGILMGNESSATIIYKTVLLPLYTGSSTYNKNSFTKVGAESVDKHY